jgi:hypothetical protein
MTQSRAGRVLVSLLLCVGVLALAPSGASAHPASVDRADVSTTISAAVTFVKSKSNIPTVQIAHFELTVTTADGTTPDGWVDVVEGDGFWDGIDINDTVTEANQRGFETGDHTFTFVFHPTDLEYLSSETTVTATAPHYVPEMEVEGVNSANGVLSLWVRVGAGDIDPGDVIVFEAEGQKPVTVHLGQASIPGRPDFDYLASVFTRADFDGLKKGTYHATATYVPSATSNYLTTEGSVTTTLDRTTNPSDVWMLADSPSPGRVRLKIGIEAFYPKNAAGTLVIEDLSTKKTVATVRDPRVDATQQTVILRGVRPGVHKYLASFVPAPGLKGSLKGAKDSAKPLTVR